MGKEVKKPASIFPLWLSTSVKPDSHSYLHLAKTKGQQSLCGKLKASVAWFLATNEKELPDCKLACTTCLRIVEKNTSTIGKEITTNKKKYNLPKRITRKYLPYNPTTPTKK